MFTLETNTGFWNPIVWIIAFLILCIVIYILRSFGESSYKKGEQAKPFLSGNPEPGKGDVHIRASNIYWGFTESLKEYYKTMTNIHTGDINDYVYWFIGIIAIILIVVSVSGGGL